MLTAQLLAAAAPVPSAQVKLATLSAQATGSGTGCFGSGARGPGAGGPNPRALPMWELLEHRISFSVLHFFQY